MPAVSAWDQHLAYERATFLLEGVGACSGHADQIEFSRGTWHARRAPTGACVSGAEASSGTWGTPPQRFLSRAEADRHADVLRRSWTDIDFDRGEGANQDLVRAVEAEFVAQLASSMRNPELASGAEAGLQTECGEGLLRNWHADESVVLTGDEAMDILNIGQNLGASLDIIGAYLKNYMTDKADLVLRRVMPLCRQRGGFWLVKALNVASCVCSKQGRHEEALEALEELDSLVRAQLSALGCGEAAAWAFYDMLHKNLGWTLEALGRHAEAFRHFEQAVEVKEAAGVAPTWFDHWDLGRALAQGAYRQRHAGELRRAGGILQSALELQCRAEAGDAVTRGKLLGSNGECRLLLGELSPALEVQRAEWAEAERCHREARRCFQAALGASSALAGRASEDLGAVLLRQRRWPEAREALHQALHCECCKDTVELPKLEELLRGLLLVHTAAGDGERPGKPCYQGDVLLGAANLRRRRVDEAEPAAFAALLLRACRLIGAHEGLLQEAAACLQLAWELGPGRGPDPTLYSRVFLQPVGPRAAPPRSCRQSLDVGLVALLPELRAEVAALRAASRARSAGSEPSGRPLPTSGYLPLD